MNLKRPLAFFLGGHDLEMLIIRELLLLHRDKASFCDKHLAWGARLSNYGDEIAAAAERHAVPVAIELADDMPTDWPPRAGLVAVDHHGARHREASALRQVFDLLQLPESQWTRDFELAAANDTGHVRELRRIGASHAEIADIRRCDRAAQGITADQEREGLEALRRAEVSPGGRLLIVVLANGRSAAVTDPLHLEAGFESLPRQVLILSPEADMFFGARSVIDMLRERFPRGFSGGQGEDGFFGLTWKDDGSSAEFRAAVEEECSAR